MNHRYTGIIQNKKQPKKSVLHANTIKSFLKRRAPKQLVIQLTTKCNALCPQCGMRVTNKFKRNTLSSNDVKQIIDHAVHHNFEAVSFTGGEPLLESDRLITLIDYACNKQIPYVRTGTNGFIFKDSSHPKFRDKIERIAERLAGTGLYTFWISIDSANPKIHESMRGLDGVIKGIEKALPIFHKYNIYPAANLGINRNTGGLYNEDTISVRSTDLKNEQLYADFRIAFKKFYSFVIDLGFTITNACYPMSIDHEQDDLEAVYTATSLDQVVNFNKLEKAAIFQALFDTIPEYRSKIRIFTPRSSLYSLIKQYTGISQTLYPCRGGIDFFFINTDDIQTYPCGYRGSDSLGDFTKIDFNRTNAKPSCIKCDWECFRDPSTLLGPLLNIKSLLGCLFKDRTFIKTWKADLRYYKAAQFFNGRLKPDWKSLEKAVQTI